MLSQAEIINSEDTSETKDNSIYIETEKEPEDVKQFPEQKALETLYLPIESRRSFSSEVYEKQVGWWFGRVEELYEKHFTAIMEDLQGRINTAEFDIEELSPSEIDLLVPGAKFSYSITQSDKRSGREYISKISLSGLPIWREKDSEKARELGDKLFPKELLDF